MAKSFKMKILTLGKIVMDNEVEKVFISSASGKVEVLANHAASIFSTIPSITRIIDAEGNEQVLFTSKGVMNIKNNEVTLCCDSAEYKNDIDLQRAEKSKERAERRINAQEKYNLDRAKEALLRAELRIKIVNDK